MCAQQNKRKLPPKVTISKYEFVTTSYGKLPSAQAAHKQYLRSCTSEILSPGRKKARKDLTAAVLDGSVNHSCLGPAIEILEKNDRRQDTSFMEASFHVYEAAAAAAAATAAAAAATAAASATAAADEAEAAAFDADIIRILKDIK